MNFYDTMKRFYGPARLSGKDWAGLFGALLLLFSAATAQKETKSQSPPPQTQKRAERLKVSAKPLVVEKKLFFQKASLGTVTSILPARLQLDSQSAFWIAAEWGAASVTDSGKLRSSVRFERMGGKVAPVDMDGDGNFEFISRGGGQEEIRLFDREGRQLWKYGLGMDPAAGDASCGDLNGDGQLECVVGMKGAGGIRLLDKNGRERWRKPDLSVWHVEVLDWDGDGKNEILHTNAAGQLRVRNANGEIVRELPGNNFITLFNLCRWPETDSGWFILSNNNRTGIQLIDFKDNVVAAIPTTAKGYEAVGTPVRLEAEGKPYFAMLVCNCTPRRDSRLYLYDPDGDIIYEEKLLPSQAALLAVPDEITPGLETLLVGEGEGKVWQYRLVPATPSSRGTH